jgi:hypothetical protein
MLVLIAFEELLERLMPGKVVLGGIGDEYMVDQVCEKIGGRYVEVSGCIAKVCKLATKRR